MSKPQPLVSILLPVYNGERTLKATVESLLTQTFLNFELLICIDGTKDTSIEIARSFNDKRVKIHENEENLGLAKTLNKLVLLTNNSSEFIAMAEQDDVYVKERIEWQVEVMQKNKDIGLVSGIAEFVSPSKKVYFPGILVKKMHYPQGKALFRYLYLNQLKVVNTCMMFRKSIHKEYNLTFKDTYGNFNVDWNYILRFSLVSKIYGIPKKLVEMNRDVNYNSVTTNKASQHRASRKLVKDFYIEYPNILKRKDYMAALKMCHKIELGYKTKLKIVFFSLFYGLWYLDSYFLKYLSNRVGISKFDIT